MTLNSFLLILRRQLTQKWGRFLLASGGIMIGIWAITMTTSLSLGLSDTIVQAINSQPAAKEIRLYKTSSNQTSFFEISEAPKFVAISLQELQSIENKYSDRIADIVPSEVLSFYQPSTQALSCVEEEKRLNQQTVPAANVPPTESASQSPNAFQDFEAKCPTVSIISNVFQNFYESNRTRWLGKTEAPTQGEIVACFKCGSLDYASKLGVEKPEDLLGKEITLEYKNAPNSFEAGKVVDVLGFETSTKLTTSAKETFKIVSVVDDREDSTFSGGGQNFFVDFSYYTKAISIHKPDIDINNIGFIENVVFAKSYEQVNGLITDLQNDKYLPFSIVQALISSVQTAFLVLSAVLAGFGFIALIASVFGIVNVMTISVLERQKEIGVLKALGAKDRDIFFLFLMESSLLGVLGWILGTLAALGIGSLISLIFKQVIENNAEWQRNLESLNINDFAPSFPWWLLLGTLGLAVFFTAISGVFPAIRASRQNPVEVLRNE